ncbi:hypothetical protein Emed_001301 [Eimeria media]
MAGGGMWSARPAPTVGKVRRQSVVSSSLSSSSMTHSSAHKEKDAAKPRDAIQSSNNSSKRRLSVCSTRRREESKPSDSEDNKENVATSNACTGAAVQPRKPLKLQRRRSSIPGASTSSRSKADERGGAAAAGAPRIHRELRGLDQATPLKSRRTSAYHPGWTLQQKLDLLLKLGIVATTKINYSEEVHTLSICGQFAEENHLAMLQDSDRVSHYRKAMHWTGDPSSGGRKLVEGKRVLEIGTGPICLLSINAVNAGAAHVVALEASRPSHCRAKKFVEAIGMNHMIDVVLGYSKRVPREIFKKPQLIIHEIIGDFASQEGVADAILDVQQRTGTCPLSIPYGAETLGRSILSPRRILLQSIEIYPGQFFGTFRNGETDSWYTSLVLLPEEAESQMSFTAYRPLQYEAALGFPLGPWGRASLSSAPVEKLLGTNHFLVFLLPPAGVHLDVVGAKQVREIEKMLLDRHSTAAVAFAKETPDLKILLERLRTDEHAGDLARASLMRPFLSANAQYKQEWQPAPTTKGLNLTAWLKGRPREDGSPSPTLVLVAHHDAFASVPHFASGVSNSGSGVIALMWLARELGKLYKQNSVDFSVAFVLADASALNYEGVAQWIGHADPR